MGYLSKRGSRAARVCLACATAVAVTVTVVGIGQAPPSYAAAGTVTGSVFRDFDGDGTRDAGNTAAGVQTDIGFAGVTVTAYDPHNEVVGTAAPPRPTAATRSTPPRSLTGRLCGSSSPTPTAAPQPTSSRATFSPPSTARTTARVCSSPRPGTRTSTSGCSNPRTSPTTTPRSSPPSSTPASARTRPAPICRPWWRTPGWCLRTTRPRQRTRAYPGRVDLASYGAVGSVWGTAFNRRQNVAYAAATYKRVSDMGPLGLGGIYRIPDVVNQATGALNAAPGPVEPWLDVDDSARRRPRHHPR